MKPMKKKDFLKMIKREGWVLDNRSGRGDHETWILGGITLSVPRHCPISQGVLRQYERKMKELGR